MLKNAEEVRFNLKQEIRNSNTKYFLLKIINNFKIMDPIPIYVFKWHLAFGTSNHSNESWV